MSRPPPSGIFPSPSTRVTVCVKHACGTGPTRPRDPRAPYLVPERFSWWRKPAEADFPGAESVGTGIKRCAQAALGGLGHLAHASH